MGQPAGSPRMPIFIGPYQQKVKVILDKYRNVPYQAEYEENTAQYIRFEPPIYCQQLYSEVLSPAVQEVLTNKNAEPQTILHQSARMFQQRFLDKGY